MNLVVSKSMAKAVHCETYFEAHYLTRSPVRSSVAPIAETGIAFHRYRSVYINHLINCEVSHDIEWIQDWLRAQPFGEDARKIIERDIDRFSINPDTVMGTEMLLSVDADLRPVERVNNFVWTPDRARHPEATDTGILDLLLIEGDRGRVVDYKSGYSTSTVSDEEPPRYAGLALAHFPQLQEVEFYWEFTRFQAAKKVSYFRRDLPEISKMMRAVHARIDDIRRRKDAGERLGVNALAGLCPFCQLQCPLKNELTKIDIPPIQNIEDARKVAQITYLAKIIARRGPEALNAWINDHGPIDLDQDWVAELRTSEIMELPMVETLKVLGLEPAPLGTMEENDIVQKKMTPRYPLPISKLRVSSTQLNDYGKARKRAGMLEELGGIAIKTPRSRLVIGRRGEENQLED